MASEAKGYGLVRGVLAASSGTVAYLALQFGALLIITNTGGAPDASAWFLAQAVATPVSAFASMRLQDQLSVSPEILDLVDRLRRLLVVSIVVGSITTLGWLLFTDGQTQTVGIGFLIANFFQQFIFAIQGVRARRGSLLGPSQLNTLLGVLSLLSILIGYQVGGLASGAILMACSWGAVALAAVVFEVRALEGTRHKTSVRLRDDLAMGVTGVTETGQISVARLIVRIVAGQASLAVFGTVSFLVRLGVIVVNAAKATIAPTLTQARVEGRLDEEVRRILRAVEGGAFLAAPVMAGFGYVAGPMVIGTLFGPEVVPEASTAAAVLGGAAFLYLSMILAHLAVAKGRHNDLAKATIWSLIATLVTALPSVLFWGTTGGAVALNIGYFARYLFVRRLVCDSHSQLIVPRLVGVGVVAFSLVIHGAFALTFLAPNELPDTHSDAIIVLSGGEGERLDRALDLLEIYQGAELLISEPPHPPLTTADAEARALCERGPIGASPVVCVPIFPDSTDGEAVAFTDYLSTEGLENAILVTSDFHQGRSARWFSRCGATVYNAPAETVYDRSKRSRETQAVVQTIWKRTCWSQ